MRLTTKEIPAVEMTKAEEKELYDNFYTNGYRWTLDGHTIVGWWNDDGHNMVHIEGENTARDIYLVD